MSYERHSLQASASIVAISVALLASGSVLAGALPTHGHFASGQGSINKANQSITVKQSSTTGIINWKSFSVGQKNGVTFDNGNGATLNRVTGGNLSTIAGNLHATGSVYLLNSQGAIVTGTGRVVTGGNFAMSSGNLNSTAFGTDDLHARGAKASIINRGSITAGGNASLVGSSVTNTGTIKAASVDLRAGQAGLVAGGNIRATGSASQDARIVVISRTGETKVTGDLVARNANGTGGAIETSGHTLSIAGKVNAGKGGSWLLDPVNLTVKSSAANTIDNSLNAGTNVTLKTTSSSASGPGKTSSGEGNIYIDSALSWSTNASLTLSAYHSIIVNAPMTVTGHGGVNLTNGTGGGGDLRFEGGNLAFSSTHSALTINGTSYTLVNSVSALANDIANNNHGDYALAHSYDASADGTYTSSPITTTFEGDFDGLGNTVSNLKIHDPGDFEVGLFEYVGFHGAVSDLHVTNETVEGGGDVGGIAGFSRGVLFNDSNSGTVDGGKGAHIGGLVGSMSDDAIVADSSSSATVYARHSQGQIGGLVGYDDTGEIANSHATGSVKGGHDASVGGLIGSGHNMTITNSYATGTVKDTSNGNTGGLAGKIVDASIDSSFATGSVTGENGAWVGGLIGYNDNGTISNAYATGAATSGGGNANVGGFVGFNAGDITASYSTGAVSGGAGAFIGGFVGDDESGGGIASSYWDRTTSGISSHSQGAGNVANDAGITGLSNSQLKSGLPAGFSSSVWGESSAINGGLPYLIGVTPA